jgi:hypothetical protein
MAPGYFVVGHFVAGQFVAGRFVALISSRVILSRGYFVAGHFVAYRFSSVTHLFNFIFTWSEFPSRWKCAVVLPIPKVYNPACFSDFRPISLLPCLSKVCEVLMAQVK